MSSFPDSPLDRHRDPLTLVAPYRPNLAAHRYTGHSADYRDSHAYEMITAS